MVLTRITEALESAKIAGSNLGTAEELIDNGPWDHELCDPEATVTGGVYLPIGPWATGKLTKLLSTQPLTNDRIQSCRNANAPIRWYTNETSLPQYPSSISPYYSQARHGPSDP